MKTTTIQLEKNLVETLKKIRERPRQTYNKLIGRMVKIFSGVEKRDSYDKFLHTIQQNKMRELWDNKKDVEWEGS